MNLKDQLFIIRNKLFDKRNIVLTIVMTIVLLVLFSCITIIQFSIENKNEILNDADTRTYKIFPEFKCNNELVYTNFTEEQINAIKEIEHIELVMSDKYRLSKIVDVPDFDNGNEKGVIYIKALIKDDDIKIKSGTNIKNKNEIVCSNTFYPHEPDERIYKNLFLSSNDILNKTIKVISLNEDLNNKEITLKIVGTYKNKFMEESNTCYTNIETYDEIVSKYASWDYNLNDNGEVISKEPEDYKDYFIRIDSKENIDKVLKELDKMEISYDKTYILDSTFLDMLLSIPLFISIIVIILTLSILHSFISKKINNRKNNIGILESIGYDEKTIVSLNINENIIIIFISTIVSFFIYFITFHYLKYTLLAEYTFANCIINIPYLLIFLSLILYCLIVSIITKNKLNKVFKLTIQNQLEK